MMTAKVIHKLIKKNNMKDSIINIRVFKIINRL